MLGGMSLRRWLGASIVALLLGSVPAAADARPIDRVSEYEPTATEAWAEQGFRIQLRFGSEASTDLETRFGPRSMYAFAAEPGIRLGRWISISGTLKYTVLGDLGLRWTNTFDLSLHLFHGLFVSGGVGYGGAMIGPECSGGGLVQVVRAGWLFPLGQVFSTGPVVQADFQSPIDCGHFPPDGFSTRNFSWSFGWR